MQLFEENWMPVRTRTGERRWIAPDQLSDPDLVAFDSERADFNGALMQFGIGLLTTTIPLEDGLDWRGLFQSPPDRSSLRRWFQPHATAFKCDGDGPRFLQDFSLTNPPDVGIASLLIDSPGENAIKNNSDHFVKRGRIEHLCPHCAITALLTLQINAPAGGAGNRTGLRGGGPLTTLLACQPTQSLWHDLWLNVMELPASHAYGGDPKKTAAHFTFPWLADITGIQKEGGETSPLQTHPFHVFWGMPRRIRLDFQATQPGECDLCHRFHEQLIHQYATRPYGLNYKGPWDHVLSPYYETKEGWLPLHPQPGGFGYRHWLAWVLGAGDDKQRQRPARVLEHYRTTRRANHAGTQLKLWAFGYDMENMKPRCWYESTLPLYGLEGCDTQDVVRIEAMVGTWLEAAKFSLYALRSAVKSAWFGGDARGDYSAVDAAFWTQTESAFYEYLKLLISSAREGRLIDGPQLGQLWLQALSRACLRLFDEVFVGAGQIGRQNPQRVAAAHKLLRNTLYGNKLRAMLNLPVTEPAGKGSKRLVTKSN
ncbi:type I-E CRISPR-associated protein Cse1/CasA [Roseateles sp. SL47]|uniref:type I-E CRISPR-associated protein Cse1/CasA n=1 Tax=Roseateles sp. SL47 TaxID=2995138 RepID=UPI0022721A98|nr:type I-E CRISPR-associated protein Cse1/CasA [Roseateles sp. SL47]WAC73097.1 type I-E CRISPR-associated protein Cse1/CasA [Roseateles sp. SL47]